MFIKALTGILLNASRLTYLCLEVRALGATCYAIGAAFVRFVRSIT